MILLPRPFDQWTTYQDHKGIDYGQPAGTPIRASGPGRVDYSAWYSTRGGWAKFITYDNGVRCGYYHLQNLSGAAVGDRVREGDTFAFVGSTGFSTGPHLHHEVWINGRLVKPPRYWEFIDKTRYVGQGGAAGGGEKPLPAPPPLLQEDESMNYIRISGKSGARTGGTYAVFNDGGGKYSAILVGQGGPDNLNTVTDEKQISKLQAKISGLGKA